MEILRMKPFSKVMNDQTFTDYYYRLMLLARSVFKWEGLPNFIDEKWIEKILFHHGYCVMYDDPMRGIMIAECTLDGTLNNYEEPTTVTPVGIGIEPRTLTVGKDCVLIRNNDEMLPTAFSLKLFAYRLAEISRTIDINIHAQKTPVLVRGTEKQKLSLKNAYSQWDGNSPVIFSDSAVEWDGFSVLRTDAPVVFTDLQRQKQNIWNEALTFLGINNANTEKRERLITDEVEANDDHIDLSADCFKKAREKACEEIKRVFGCDVTVKMRREEEEK